MEIINPTDLHNLPDEKKPQPVVGAWYEKSNHNNVVTLFSLGI
jgi:hypothetical protein